jgi:cytochrome c biogenesis protein CcmG/thiol:disulfide interchange protein DsbE
VRRALAGLVPLVLAALAPAALLGACSSGGAGSSSVAAVGRRAPTFATFDLDGRPVRLADALARGPVLVNFWASWCVPCRSEFPMLARVNGHGVSVLGVVFEDTAAEARKFMAEEHATWPGLVDPKGQIADAYGVHPKPGIPETFALDRAGVVRAKHLGPLSSSDLSGLLHLLGAT